MKKNVVNGLMWKLMERFGAVGVQFIVSVLLARFLDPSHYGMLAIMNIFVVLANVFVQTGFNTALIQNKDVTEEDYSSVFWVSLSVALILYAMMFFLAPVIAYFYNAPDIILPFRVLTLMLIPGAFNSIQLAKISRAMDFKKVFYSNIAGCVTSGAVGISFALMGFGLWALVAQSLTNVLVNCVVMMAKVKWFPRLVLNIKRVRVLFSFGWKLLVSSLLDTLFHDLTSLIVGKKYNTETLGFYNRGLQFPQAVINPINSSLQSVLLPAMSEHQEDPVHIKKMVRNSITLGCYIIFPLMAGLAAVAEPMVKLLLTDKWLPCVPYLQIFCLSYAPIAIHCSNLQAFNAMGRSDIFLKLEIVKKAIAVTTITAAVVLFESPLALAARGAIMEPLAIYLNTFPSRKLFGYSMLEQLKDILPALLLSGVMFAVVYAIQLLPLAPIFLLLLQVGTGIAVYVGLSLLFRVREFRTLLNIVKDKLLKKNQGM